VVGPLLAGVRVDARPTRAAHSRDTVVESLRGDTCQQSSLPESSHERSCPTRALVALLAILLAVRLVWVPVHLAAEPHTGGYQSATASAPFLTDGHVDRPRSSHTWDSRPSPRAWHRHAHRPSSSSSSRSSRGSCARRRILYLRAARAGGAMLSHTAAVVQATGRGAAMHPSSHLAAGTTPSSTARRDERSSPELHCRPGTPGSCTWMSDPRP